MRTVFGANITPEAEKSRRNKRIWELKHENMVRVIKAKRPENEKTTERYDKESIVERNGKRRESNEHKNDGKQKYIDRKILNK